MTRETKIGLLVGLAFIIVIGILLSDHMATSTEPTQAALNTAADTARQAIVVPNESRGGAVVPNNIVTRDITPPAPIPTRNELTQNRVVNDISVSGGGPMSTGNTTGSTINSGVAMQDPGNNTTGNTVTPPSGVDSRLQDLARQHGEPIVDAGSQSRDTQTRDTQTRDSQTRDTRTVSAAKTYTVQAGDTLGRIASKTMGANTKANRDAIVKANPQISNPDRVVIGQVYNIPGATVLPPSGTSSQQAGQRVLQLQAPPSTARDTRQNTVVASSDSTLTYTVKAGDNLYRIATDHVGNPGAVAAIKELNKDVLKGGDGIRVGMRLKLPAKPIASAN